MTSFSREFQAKRIFRRHPRGLTPVELANALAIHRQQSHRIIRRLADEGLVVPVRKRGKSTVYVRKSETGRRSISSAIQVFQGPTAARDLHDAFSDHIPLNETFYRLSIRKSGKKAHIETGRYRTRRDLGTLQVIDTINPDQLRDPCMQQLECLLHITDGEFDSVQETVNLLYYKNVTAFINMDKNLGILIEDSALAQTLGLMVKQLGKRTTS